MEKSFFLSGIGGQGIQLLGKVLLNAFNENDMNGSYFPTYTGTRRGGYSFCSVIANDQRIGAPSLPQYDVTVLMDADSSDIFMEKVKSGGILIINKDLTPDAVLPEDAKVYNLPFTTYSEETGNTFTFNVILAGFMAEVTQIVPVAVMKEETLKKLGRTEQMRRDYDAAFDKGVAIAREQA